MQKVECARCRRVVPVTEVRHMPGNSLVNPYAVCFECCGHSAAQPVSTKEPVMREERRVNVVFVRDLQAFSEKLWKGITDAGDYWLDPFALAEAPEAADIIEGWRKFAYDRTKILVFGALPAALRSVLLSISCTGLGDLSVAVFEPDNNQWVLVGVYNI